MNNTQRAIKYNNNFYSFLYDFKKAHPGSHYFDRETLKFFGENLSSMRILKNITIINDDGTPRECFTLSKLGKDFRGYKRRNYAYFDCDTLEYIII